MPLTPPYPMSPTEARLLARRRKYEQFLASPPPLAAAEPPPQGPSPASVAAAELLHRLAHPPRPRPPRRSILERLPAAAAGPVCLGVAVLLFAGEWPALLVYRPDLRGPAARRRLLTPTDVRFLLAVRATVPGVAVSLCRAAAGRLRRPAGPRPGESG